MAWFELKGDERLGRCASEKCGGQPTYRFECDGVGSNYCSGCKSKIDWARGAYDKLAVRGGNRRGTT